jgi:Tfp pilus assembly protein PilX
MKERMKKYRDQSGQVVLITLLVLTIATTVALSLISRTTTDTRITAQVEESSRAFNAAEAGVEEALKSGVGTNGAQVLTPGVSYTVSVASIGNAVGVYEFPKKTLKGVTETLWLVAHDVNGVPVIAPTYTAPSIDVCWSSESVTPAMVVTVLYRESSDSSYRVVKAAFDPDTLRSPPNQFTQTYVPGGCGGNTNTTYKETITFNALSASIDPTVDTVIALRIRPVYSDAKLAIDAGTTVLPLQGNRIESTGTTSTGTNRKIVVYQQYRSASTVFDAALYSQGMISK